MVYEGVTFRGSSTGEIVKSTFTRDSLAPEEVAIEVTHSGLCGTDLHFLRAGVVLGHEGIGVVKETGIKVKTLKVGDRVGWCYTFKNCGTCHACLTAHESYCPNSEKFGTHHADQGGFGSLAIKAEDWLFKLPDGLKSEHAGPLMCGGATVFSPLIEYLKPTDRVGVVGIGGLGHLAVQFARKMGCDVVAFSGTESKREDALKLGAREFYAVKGTEDYSALNLPKPLDALIVAASENVDLSKWYQILNPVATVVFLTISTENIVAPILATVARGIKIIGTVPASKLITAQTLEFAERNNVVPIIEKFAMSEEGITSAIDKLAKGNIRYRGVVTWESNQ